VELGIVSRDYWNNRDTKAQHELALTYHEHRVLPWWSRRKAPSSQQRDGASLGKMGLASSSRAWGRQQLREERERWLSNSRKKEGSFCSRTTLDSFAVLLPSVPRGGVGLRGCIVGALGKGRSREFRIIVVKEWDSHTGLYTTVVTRRSAEGCWFLRRFLFTRPYRTAHHRASWD